MMALLVPLLAPMARRRLRARRRRDIIKFRVLDHHYDHLPLGGGYIVAASFARQTQK